MRSVLFWLHIAQTFGILLAVVLAVIDIESIVISGPILSVTGALIAFLAHHRDHLLGLLFGLSPPTVAAFCLFVIAMLEWSPADAQVPVAAFLVLYGLLCVPICVLAEAELQSSRDSRRKVHFQYSIAAMLVLMLVLAIVLGLTQTAGGKGLAAGISLAYLSALFYVLNQFFRNRRLQKLAGLPSMFSTPRVSQPESPFDP